MKNILLLFVVLPFFVFSQTSGNFYTQTIYLDESITDAGVKNAVEDLSYFLQKATGRSFKVIKTKIPASGGINIFMEEHISVPANLQQKLNKGSIESFVENADKEKLDLLAMHPKGIVNAIYSYLDELGFRWYLPGDEWTYIPQLNNLSVTNREFVSPSFRIRNFFGTGGIVPVKSIDPDGSLGQTWSRWGIRNRLGQEMELRGHYGEWFNLQHKKELEAHPEYLALLNGKRVSWSEGAKWCISNAQLRALYIEDRLKEAKEELQKKEYGNEIVTVNVEPADGGGDCECDLCKKMGTASDRVFFLANETAKALKKLGNRVYVNLYAYNTHATPPPFNLVSNVIVQVIPYAFQTYAAPKQMIDDWKRKSNDLFIYDYWGLTDWHYNLPLSDRWSIDTLVDHIKYWKSKNIQGFLLESSYSIGSTGLGLFLAARLGWNDQQNIEKEQKTFFSQMFGSSAPVIKEYYKQTNHGFNGLSDVTYLQNKLNSERNLQTDPKIAGRILQLQAYLHYLLLYYQWKAVSDNTKEAGWEKLMRYNWQLYHSALIHTTRIAEMLCWQSGLPDAITKEWNPDNVEAKNLQKIKQLDESEIKQLVEADVRKNPLLEDFAYLPLKKKSYRLKQDSLKNEKPDEGLLILIFPETYIRPSKALTAEFYIKVNIATKNNNSQNVVMEVIDTSANKTVFATKFSIDSGWKKIRMKLPAEKTYKLVVKNENWIRLFVPKSQWWGITNIPTHTVMRKLWFWMPEKTKYLYYSNNSKEQPVFFDPSGKLVRAEMINDDHMYRLSVSAGQSGKWWNIDETQYQFIQFYNKPDIFFFYSGYEVN